MNPFAYRNAATISHTVVLLKPFKASLVFIMPVSIIKLMAINAIAPTGNGCRINATTVVMNIARMCQVKGVNPSGTGENHIASATIAQIRTFK